MLADEKPTALSSFRKTSAWTWFRDLDHPITTNSSNTKLIITKGIQQITQEKINKLKNGRLFFFLSLLLL